MGGRVDGLSAARRAETRVESSSPPTGLRNSGRVNSTFFGFIVAAAAAAFALVFSLPREGFFHSRVTLE